MSYKVTISVVLGSSMSGLSLEAQIIDENGNDVGSAINTGFVEIGSGNYLWTGDIPNNHRGAIKFYAAGNPGTILAISSIDPSDVIANIWDISLSDHIITGTTGNALYTSMSNVTTIPEDIWNYAPRTLTQVSAAIPTVYDGSKLIIQRGDTTTIDITGLGDISDYTAIDFTLKAFYDDPDSQALLRIRANVSGTADGLLVLNGAAPTYSSWGSITILDDTTGNIRITIDALATKELKPRYGVYYDIQLITPTRVTTLSQGFSDILADITRATS